MEALSLVLGAAIIEAMNLELKPLKRADEPQVVRFAVDGMHFDHYIKSARLQRAYAGHFWLASKMEATEQIALYSGEVLAGVLLARMIGGVAVGVPPLERVFVRTADALLHVVSRKLEGAYQRANERLLSRFLLRYTAEGEITFLAVNPALKRQGVGRQLVEELATRHEGKRVYVFSDEECDFGFYDHMRFTKEEEEAVSLVCSTGRMVLPCFLYSKVL